MARFRRQRNRAWVGLGVLFGLMLGGLPAGDDCPLLASSATGPDSGPDCCHAPEPLPSRAVLPASGPTGADPSCRTRTASCCCNSAVTPVVAERSARPRAEAAEARGLDTSPVPPASTCGRPLVLAASSRPGTPKVPLYLKTARLRN